LEDIVEYRATRIVDVIRDLNRDMFLPDIQREFVWDTSAIERLFDSIMSDFPIGSFLFWKVLNENKNDWGIYEFIKNFDKERPHNEPITARGNRDIQLVLDGQQRITSFYIGLKGSYRYFYYRWRTTKLYLNLLKETVPNEDDPEEPLYQFSFRDDDAPQAEGEYWYEVGRILDTPDAEDARDAVAPELTHLSDDVKSNALKIVARLHSRIHTYPTINFYEEKVQDYHKVLNIFVRANSEGKRLEYSDLLLSTATAKWEHLNAREEIYDFTDRINEIGSGYGFGKDFVLKSSLYLTDNLPIQYKVGNFTRPNLRRIESNWEEIKTYLKETILLAHKFGFGQKNITAPLALLPIALYLYGRGAKDIHKSSDSDDVRTLVAIRRWLIHCLLKNAFGSSTDTKLRNIREVLFANNGASSFPVDEINRVLGIEDTLSTQEIEWLLAQPYQGRYTFLALSLLYPNRDWKDTVFHEDHIFPKSEFTESKLKKRGYDDEQVAFYMEHHNSLANLQLLTDSENLTKSAKPFDEWLGTRDADFKERHSVPELQSYSLDSFADFVSKRRSRLIEVYNNL
jgi:hypothetical protein